jgi:ABC-2 type transport system permease protein
MKAELRAVWALIRRGLNEVFRLPAATLPGVLAPTIFMIGLSGVFGKAAALPGFTADDFRTFIIPVGLLQGAGFSGAATGVNLARDIEHGWFDRLVAAPISRPALLAGTVLSASVRALLPGTVLVSVGLALGVHFPGWGGLALAVLFVTMLASVAACWAVLLALRFRTQQAAPLMQVGTFVAVLFTTAYAPSQLLTDWLRTITDINPVTHVLEGVRQGFVGGVTWGDTWPALVSLAGLLIFFGGLALRGLVRSE